VLTLVNFGVYQVERDHTDIKDVVRGLLEMPKDLEIVLYMEESTKPWSRGQMSASSFLSVMVVEEAVSASE
jgi:hypothetical protein